MNCNPIHVTKPEPKRLGTNARESSVFDEPEAIDPEEIFDVADCDIWPPESYHAGQCFGRYELVRRVGCGGMGSVWVGRHLELDSEVAIKLLRTDAKEDPLLVERFLKEGRMLARVDHPAVVRISDFAHTAEDDPFLVMELLSGESLYDLLAHRDRLPAEEAVRLMLPIAEGLCAVHAHRIVHRDLKPDNIFIAELDNDRQQPKLVDFGVARTLDPEPRLTSARGVLGSPEYMPPEQAAGEPDVDHRADIWSFCAVLYECVTGQRVFRMEDSYERLLRRVIEEPVAPISEWGVNEPELWKILKRGLEKNPDNRWQDAEQLSAALADWLVRRGIREDISGTSIHTQAARAASIAPLDGPWEILKQKASGLMRADFSRSAVVGLALGLCVGALTISTKPIQASNEQRTPAGVHAPAGAGVIDRTAMAAPDREVTREADDAVHAAEADPERDVPNATPDPVMVSSLGAVGAGAADETGNAAEGSESSRTTATRRAAGSGKSPKSNEATVSARDPRDPRDPRYDQGAKARANDVAEPESDQPSSVEAFYRDLGF